MMTQWISLLAVIAVNLGLSLLLVAWQQRALGPLLNESCPGSGAHYWRHTLAALQLLIPLLLVLFFVDSHISNPVETVQTMLICLVLGHLIAIASIAKMVWRRLVPPQALAQPEAVPAPDVPSAAAEAV
ncbi:hypothetical protein NT239_08555 [Chitinibacter sp. SCUT-21]|uniref:hypothetical protein n=1 Tax=Chitinibacter sp. SCUT-21 TaxID=2970891 RepID=UPI0035A64EF6